MPAPNSQVNHFLDAGCGRCDFYNTPRCKVNKWRSELIALRNILLSLPLREEVKWSMPCYTYNGKNIVMLSAFKDYCALSFFKGALLKDGHQVLIRPGENSRVARMMRFTGISEIRKLETAIQSYILEAIELENSGAKVKTENRELTLPAELKEKFREDPQLKKAFAALTPGRQRGYVIYFSQPKQSATRIARIEKCIPLILQGKGLHDDYKR